MSNSSFAASECTNGVLGSSIFLQDESDDTVNCCAGVCEHTSQNPARSPSKRCYLHPIAGWTTGMTSDSYPIGKEDTTLTVLPVDFVRLA